MEQATLDYAVPTTLSPALTQVLAYWQGLKRGGASMPFWDDVKLNSLSELGDHLALIDVFEYPERFRFQLVGRALAASQPEPILGKFLDEVRLQPPLSLLRAQCAAAVESGAPTYADTEEPEGLGRTERGRLALPLWGEGLVHMLLIAVG